MTNLKIVEDVNEELYPRVREQRLFTKNEIWDANTLIENEKILTTHKSIVNEQGNPIAVVGSGYTLVQNADIMPQMEQAIMESGLDTTDMQRSIAYSHNGARTVVSYTFPSHTIEVKENDKVSLQISVLNSYDGSWRFMSLVGAIRLACANGQVIGDYFSSFYGKHTKNLDTDDAVRKLESALDVFSQNAELWKKYPSTPVNELQVERVLKSLSKGSKAMLAELHKIHAFYVDEMGHNLWALFNTMTDWSSHSKFKNEGNRASTVINREARVRKVLPMLDEIRRVA